MKLLRIPVYILLLTLFSVVNAYAQALDCPALFRAAVAAAAQNCAGLERNQACIASGTVTLTPSAGHADATFAQPGDRIDAAAIAELTQAGGEAFAMTVMRLQLNQPDSATEHNSVLLLLGDLSLQVQEMVEASSPEPEQAALLAEVEAQINEESGQDGLPSPIQAFTFASDGTHACSGEVPQGVIIQSPNFTPADGGYMPTELWINDWRFALGSTVLVNNEVSSGTTVEVLEHYASIAGQDGDVLVLVGQGVDLPSGTPFVSNEDGTIVVIPRPTTAPEGDDGFFDDLLDMLFGEEEVVNRSPDAHPSSASDVLALVQSNDRLVSDGVWKFDVYSEVTYGQCAFNYWVGLMETSNYIALDEVVEVDAQGNPTSLSLMDNEYSFTSPGMSSSLGSGRTLEASNGVYAAVQTALGNMVTEIVTLYVLTPFYLQGRFVGRVQDPYGPRGCTHVVHFDLSSCVGDLLIGKTDGSRDCPVEIHQAMGTAQ